MLPMGRLGGVGWPMVQNYLCEVSKANNSPLALSSFFKTNSPAGRKSHPSQKTRERDDFHPCCSYSHSKGTQALCDFL